MCMTNTKGIDHVIPVMLDTKNDAKFGPLHGPWEKEHIQQARQHVSYILINSKNYASGKDQIRAAWATKFSSRNLKEYGDGSKATKRWSQIDLMRRKSKMTKQTRKISMWILSMMWPDDDQLDVAIGSRTGLKK